MGREKKCLVPRLPFSALREEALELVGQRDLKECNIKLQVPLGPFDLRAACVPNATNAGLNTDVPSGISKSQASSPSAWYVVHTRWLSKHKPA